MKKLLVVLVLGVIFFGFVEIVAKSQIDSTMPFSVYTITVKDICDTVPRGGTPCWVAEFDGYYFSEYYNHTVTGYDPVRVTKLAIKCITHGNEKGHCVAIDDAVVIE